MMTADHVFVDSLGNQVCGGDAMRTGWVHYFTMVPDYAISVEHSFSSGQTVALFGVASGTYTADGVLRPDHRWETPVALRADVRGAKVARWQVYADNDAMRQLMEGRPAVDRRGT
jgi:ketosteroid isomerase-like protein